MDQTTMINVKASSLVRPAQETPSHRIRTTVLDRLMSKLVNPFVYFYRRPSGASDFFEAVLMKEALSKVLVPFYPMAGRLVKSEEDGEFDILCNGEGILFVEAETSCEMNDFVQSAESSLKIKQLLPALKYTKDRSSRPLVMMQVTRFRCGGVCIGGISHHILTDASTGFLFNNSWAAMARGNRISISPVVDRTVLDAGLPISPTFRHIEFAPPPPMIGNHPTQSPNAAAVSTSIIEISADQMKTLREKYSEQDDGSSPTTKISRFEILAAHIWRSICKARALSTDQLSKVEIAVDGRSKMNPQIPYGYIGNVVFSSTPIASAGEILSEPLNSTAKRIHESLDRMDDDYCKSALCYLKQLPDLAGVRRAGHISRCPNLNVSNLSNVPIYEADFGWGRPFLFRLVNTVLDGQVFILPTAANDGSLMAVVELETNHSQLFKKFFYEIFLQSKDIIVRSRY